MITIDNKLVEIYFESFIIYVDNKNKILLMIPNLLTNDHTYLNFTDEPEITAVSRSGRIIKKSLKLLGFESSDLRA